MTSTELDSIQKYLTAKLKKSLKAYDFDAVVELAKEIKTIDRKRRKAWHREKFGPYERIVDNVLGMAAGETFTTDDISF